MAEGDEKIVKFEEEPWNGSSLTNGGEFVKSSRTAGLRRKALRAAKPCLVEQESHSKKDADSMAQVKHLVKIFQNDAEIAEVSQEQVTRVKTSTLSTYFSVLWSAVAFNSEVTYILLFS